MEVINERFLDNLENKQVKENESVTVQNSRTVSLLYRIVGLSQDCLATRNRFEDTVLFGTVDILLKSFLLRLPATGRCKEQ